MPAAHQALVPAPHEALMPAPHDVISGDVPSDDGISHGVADGHVNMADVGSGHGINGMRERAASAGGQLTAGPLPSGGFQVQATLPTAAAGAGTAGDAAGREEAS